MNLSGQTGDVTQVLSDKYWKDLYLQMKLTLLTDEIIQTAASHWIKQVNAAIVPHQPMIFGNQPRPWSVPWKLWRSAGPANIKNFNHTKEGLSKPSPCGPRSWRVICPSRDFDIGKCVNCASRHSHTQNAPSRVNHTWILCQTWSFDSIQLQTSLAPFSVGKFNLKLTFN